MSLKHQKASCLECGQEFDCPVNYLSNPYCHKHVRSQNNNLQNMPQTIKEEYKKQKNNDGTTSTVVPIKIKSDSQIQGALAGNASEAQKMGAPWMLTEFIENGSDAIKQNRQNPGSAQETNTNYGNNFSGEGKIILEIDENKLEVRIIDNGSGIMDPFWIIQNPFRSMKTGQDFTIGNFGRGLSGFRGLCKNLDYFTLRSHFLPGSIEDSQQEKSLCTKVSFDETVHGKYTPIKEAEFKKYTNNQTGTVAILSNWKGNEWEKLVKKMNNLTLRMQLHFGHATIPEKFKIIVKTIKNDGSVKDEEIQPIDFTSLQPLYVEKKSLTNYLAKTVVGSINFYLYKSRPTESRNFKEPYLLIQNRPLQNSKVCDIDDFDDDVWTSKYITGYIECDFIHPNQLRNAIERDEAERVFHSNLKAITREIKKELEDYIKALNQQDKNKEFTEIRDTFQDYIKKNKIKWNKTAFKMSGKLSPGSSGKKTKLGKVSANEGGVNEGLIAEDGTIPTIVSKQMLKRPPRGPPTGKAILIKDPKSKNGNVQKLKNGKSQKIVYVNELKNSRGGVNKLQQDTGPDFKPQKMEIIKKLSWYEPSVKAIIINTGHDIYKKLDTNKTGAGGFSNKMKSFLFGQYAWNFFMEFGEQKGDTDSEQFKNKSYEFFKAIHTVG